MKYYNLHRMYTKGLAELEEYNKKAISYREVKEET